MDYQYLITGIVVNPSPTEQSIEGAQFEFITSTLNSSRLKERRLQANEVLNS